MDRRAGARRPRLFLRLGKAGARRRSLPRIPITAKLAGLALLFAVLFGVPLGVISAVQAEHARSITCCASSA